MNKDAPHLDVTIDTDENYDVITLRLVTTKPEPRDVTLMLEIPEAQLLNDALSKAITNVLLHKLGLNGLLGETKH